MTDDLLERGRWLSRNVLPHEPLLRAKLTKMCGHSLDIEDVMQETYARFMVHHSLDSIRHPRQYALLMARSIIIDHIRHAKIIPITSGDGFELLDAPTSDPDAERRLEFHQEVQAVMAALDQLPALCRETLILRRVEGFSQREVAQKLKISEKTVEKYMANGVRLLIKLFGRGGKLRSHPSNSENAMRLKHVGEESGD